MATATKSRRTKSTSKTSGRKTKGSSRKAAPKAASKAKAKAAPKAAGERRRSGAQQAVLAMLLKKKAFAFSSAVPRDLVWEKAGGASACFALREAKLMERDQQEDVGFVFWLTKAGKTEAIRLSKEA